ncbi:hypothetical protein ACFY2V_08665 [Streptomyces eurythermus]|uniref:hypothetical protein n=1 Tax=Streptomyces eurythermus TaxID=42237 RepID=UPI0036A9228D
MGMKARLAVGAIAGLAVIGTVSATAGSNGKNGGPGGGATAGSSASAEHKPNGVGKDSAGSDGSDGSGGAQASGKKRAAFGGDGDYRVGTDIEPGTYRTTGDTDGSCSWERAGDASGGPDSTLADGHVTGTGYVTIKATDKVFRTNGCADWEAVDPTAPTAKGTPAASMDGDGGMFKVGTDIAPGTYQSTGNADGSCHWERAKDAEGGTGSILARDNVTGTAVVTISASDGYFETDGCGDWKKA